MTVVALVLDHQESDTVPEPTSRPAATLTAADVRLIARRVERIRDLRFKTPPAPLFAGRAEAVRLERRGAEHDYPPAERRADEEALKLLGLLRPSDSLASAFSAIEREQVLGFYDSRRKRLVVVRDRHASRPLLEITLAHELVHALEDQRFGLREGGNPNDDAALAQSALAEGTATMVMAEYAVRYFGITDALALFESADDTQTKLPRYVEDTLLFPYDQGLRFVDTFRGASRSWKALDNVIRFRRPQTEEQVMHPGKYAVGERAAPVRIAGVSHALGAGWRRVATSSVGELDLREIFAIVGRRPSPRAAAGWGGGSFELWQRRAAGRCAAPCVARDAGVLLIAWDSRRDRREGRRALARAFGKSLADRGGTVLTGGRGLRTAVALAPDRRLAERLLRRTLGR